MKIYRDITELHLAHQGVKKWNRAFQAIAKFDLVPANQAHSIVDSLTYLITTTDRHSPDNDFVGHRRYFEAIFALDGDISIEVAPKADLLQSVAYSDLTDREHFTGSDQHLTVKTCCSVEKVRTENHILYDSIDIKCLKKAYLQRQRSGEP